MAGPDAVPRAARVHLALVGALVLVALLRGAYWAAVLDLWYLDEAAHYAYVQSLATGEGIPVLLEDRVPAEVTAAAKTSPTRGDAATPVTAAPDDPAWGAFAQQYEAGQGPVYYALLAPVSWLGRDAPLTQRLLALRLVTLLIVAAAVPLAHLLARVLFPRLVPAWFLAPALLVSWQSFNASGASVTNDALAWPLGLAALLGVALAVRHGPSVPTALLTGLAAGAGLLNKPTFVVTAPALLLGALALVRAHRGRPGDLVRWALVAGTATLLPVVTWLLWQRRVYGPVGVVERFNSVLGPILGPPRPLGADAVGDYARHVASELFGQELFQVGIGPRAQVLLAALGTVVAAGVVAAVARRRGGALAVLWLTASLPLGFLAMVAVVQGALGGVGSVSGRYLAVPLAAAAVAAAASAVLAAGPRWGTVVVAVLVALALQLEVRPAGDYVAATYLRGLVQPGVAPAVVQDTAEGTAAPAAVVVDPPCPARLLGLGWAGEPPAALSVAGAGQGARQVDLVAAEHLAGAAVLGTYDVAGLRPPLRVAVPAAPPLLVTAADRTPAVALEGAGGDPVARLHCPAADPAAVRFAQTHHPLHPDLPHALVGAWPRAWAAAGWVGAALALLAALAPRRRDGAGRRPRPERAHPAAAPPARVGGSGPGTGGAAA